ncbi:hypothetical protein [Galbibacter sp. BG1]
MKVSFDFDSTLTEERIQDLAKKFISNGIEVWVTTTRNIFGDNKDLYRLVHSLGIDVKQIEFTNGKDKYSFLKSFDLHFDDNEHEIILINEHPMKCIGVLITDIE